MHLVRLLIAFADLALSSSVSPLVLLDISTLLDVVEVEKILLGYCDKAFTAYPKAA